MKFLESLISEQVRRSCARGLAMFIEFWLIPTGLVILILGFATGIIPLILFPFYKLYRKLRPLKS